jgi:hypothetical protein
MLCYNLVNELLLIFRHVCKLSAIAGTDIFAPRAQPHSHVVEVALLLIRKMPAVEIMFSPLIVVSLFRTSEISETQTGFGPPHIVFGAVDALQHDSLCEGLHEEFPMSLV